MAGRLVKTQFGEAFVGEGAEAAHVNTVLGDAGGALEAAWVGALASPTVGHAPFVVVVQPGLAVRPPTLFVNKAALSGERHSTLTWGAAQAGVAGGVVDALADNVIGEQVAEHGLLIAAVWVNPEAADEEAVYRNNRRATRQALEAGRDGAPHLGDVLEARHHPWNAFFDPDAAARATEHTS